MKVKIVNSQGKETSKTTDLAKSIFSIEPNDHAIYLDVKNYLAHQRQGTHKSKERAEIKGSTRKIKKQKGTGTARAGSLKNPLFRSGGRVFGPKPHKYGFKLNQKLKKLARKSALSYKAKSEDILVMDDLQMTEVKTKNFMSVLNGLDLAYEKVLFVLPENNSNVYLSARNIPGSNVVTADSLNTYEIMNANKLVIVEGALAKIESNLN